MYYIIYYHVKIAEQVTEDKFSRLFVKVISATYI